MPAKFPRILLRDGDFGYIVRQVVDGATPLYLVATVHGSELIVAADNFITTDWDGTDRRSWERRRDERRGMQVDLDANMYEQRVSERRQGERRQFAVSRT
jgi:hypothetical protein